MAYQICTKSVMDTSDPSITFDANGVSNHYDNFINEMKPHWSPKGMDFSKLEVLVSSIKKAGEGKEFDCLLGLSGGLDSSYMLHTMVRQFGLRPLVFHVDGGWNSELAVHNIHALIDKLGLELYTEVINWDEMSDFQLAFFKSGVPHIDIPQDHAFIAAQYKFAEKSGVKYILNGGNISTECVVNPLQYFYWGTDLIQINDIIKKFGIIPMNSYSFSSVYRHKLYLRYFKGVKVVKPLNFIPYTKLAASQILMKEYGWRMPERKHFESRFTRFYESYWLPTRFGFDVRRVQFSSLIFTGQMTREDALRELEKPPYDVDNIMHDFEYIATKMGVSIDELHNYHRLPKKFFWDYKNQNKVLLAIESIVRLLGLGRRGSAY